MEARVRVVVVQERSESELVSSSGVVVVGRSGEGPGRKRFVERAAALKMWSGAEARATGLGQQGQFRAWTASGFSRTAGGHEGVAVGFVADERDREHGGGGRRVEERGVEVVAADVFEAGGG